MPERLLALVRSFLLGFHKLCAKERGSDLREQPNYVTYYKQDNKDDLLRAASATLQEVLIRLHRLLARSQGTYTGLYSNSCQMFCTGWYKGATA